MRPTLYWIDTSPLPWTGWLAIMARPRSGDWLADEVAGWRDAGLYVGQAFARIAQARGVPVPDTEGQRDWVRIFADTLSLLP